MPRFNPHYCLSLRVPKSAVNTASLGAVSAVVTKTPAILNQEFYRNAILHFL
jgi:hypothetical protein